MNDEKDDDDYDLDEEDLIPAAYYKDGSGVIYLPEELALQLFELNERRQLIGEDAYRDELCRILEIPREMFDKFLTIPREIRKKVQDGTISWEEAFRRSRQ